MKFLFSITLFCLLSISYAQSVIKGKVTDDQKKPVMGVNVFIKGTINGDSSDAEGNFRFKTKENGKKVLIFKHIAMNDVEIIVDIDSSVKEINIMMLEKQSDLEGVTITAGSFGVGDKKKATVLNTMDIETTAGTDGDITGALLTLPGTQQVGESGQLFVRGGSGDESKVVIDGLDIPNPYYSTVPDVAQRNRFSPHIFKGIVFNTGGYSAQYGNALSSVLSLETKDHPSKPSTVISIIPYGTQVGHDFLSRNEKTSGGFDIAYTNFKPYYDLIPQKIEWLKAPESVMLAGTFRKSLPNNGMIKWYGYANAMKQSINKPDENKQGEKHSYSSKNINAVSVLTYSQDISEIWKIYAGYGFNFNKDKVSELLTDNDLTTYQHQFRLSASAIPIYWLQLEIGSENFVFSLTNRNNIKNSLSSAYNHESATWAEADFKINPKLIFRTGLRSEYNQKLHKALLLPRFSVAYKTGKHHQLNFSAGEYSQKPNYIYLTENTNLDFSKAIHCVANFQYIHNRRIFRLESYYKRYDKLITTKDLGQISNDGFGYAKVVDFFWRDSKTLNGFDYWLSYTLLDTQRKYLDYPIRVMPTYASTHTGHFVAKYFIENLGVFIGGSYSVSSGRPYYNPNSLQFLSDRTPMYQNANINFAILRKWKNTFNTFVFAMNNILGNEQIFGYRYARDGSFRLPVTLPYKRSFMIGWFISIGQDRSSEILEQLP